MKNLIILLAVIIFLSGCYFVRDAYEKEAEIEEEILGVITGYSPKVKELQYNLKKAGYDPGQVDGKMGWQTREAIRNYQMKNKLRATGYLNEDTLVALNNIARSSKSKDLQQTFNKRTELVHKDKKGTEDIKVKLKSALFIKRVQLGLRNAGFDPGNIDGKIGKKTRKAIRDFQRSIGLSADGIIGPKTWEKLSKYAPNE